MNRFQRRFALLPVLVFLLPLVMNRGAWAQIPDPVWHTADQKTASGSGTALSVDRPDNVSEGDLILLIFSQQRSRNTTATGFSVPDGFTLIRTAQNAGGNDRPEIVAFYKIAGASEPAAYASTVTDHGSIPQWKAIATRVTGHDPWEPIGRDRVADSEATSVSSLTVPQPPGVIYDSLLVAARTVRREVSGETTPAGMTLQWSANGTGSADGNDNSPAVRVATETIPNPGIAGTREFTWTGAARASGLAFHINRYRPEGSPRVNGLYFGSGDEYRYPVIPYAISQNESEMYVTYVDGMLHVVLVVNRIINDNVFSQDKDYRDSAGWNNRTGNMIKDSEFAEFTLTVGEGAGAQTWNWQHGYAGTIGGGGGSGDPYTSQDWVSDITVSGGLGTPPPGLISDGSLAWNMNNYARRLNSSIDPGWVLGTDNASRNWTSPITNPDDPGNIINADEGYPGTGWVTYSPTYQWEWAMIYEWAIDLNQFGAAPLYVITGNSHHSPAKGIAGEDDEFTNEDTDPLYDFGDLPGPYATLLADDGARHVIDPAGARLGASIDSEADGQPHPLALGDDLAGVDDEDGIELLTPLIPGSNAVIRVTVGGTNGFLSAFLDWNGDGTLDAVTLVSADGPTTLTPGMISDMELAVGVYELTVEVPSIVGGTMPARFRVTNDAGQGGNSPTGEASSGEVEDYIWTAAIGDWVWLDDNKNGIQDDSEVGLDGITVNLYQTTSGVSRLVATTETAAGGYYLFDNLTRGDYFVEVVAPPDFVFSPQNQGGDYDLDSDADPVTGVMPVTSLYPGMTDLSWDTGLYVGSTLAVISAVRSRIEADVAVISWDVELELDTVGYYLERWTDGAWLRINETTIESRFWEFPPVTYEQADPGAPLGTTQRYRIVELDGHGRLLTYGPYELELDGGEISCETWAAGIDWGAADSSREADPDGDGLTNWQEYLAGTDPLDANSVLRVMRIEPVADGIRLTWNSEPGRRYTVEMAPAKGASFLPVTTNIPASPPRNEYQIPVDPSAAPIQFFRIIVRQ